MFWIWEDHGPYAGRCAVLFNEGDICRDFSQFWDILFDGIIIEEEKKKSHWICHSEKNDREVLDFTADLALREWYVDMVNESVLDEEARGKGEYNSTPFGNVDAKCYMY